MTNPANFLEPESLYTSGATPPKCLGVKVVMLRDPNCRYGSYRTKITIRDDEEPEGMTFDEGGFDGSWTDDEIKSFVEEYYCAPITAPYEIIRPAAA